MIIEEGRSGRTPPVMIMVGKRSDWSLKSARANGSLTQTIVVSNAARKRSALFVTEI